MNPPFYTSADLISILPEIIVTITAILVLTEDMLLKHKTRIIPGTALLGILVAFVITLTHLHLNGSYFRDFIKVDLYAHLFNVIFLTSAFFSTLLAWAYMKDHPENRAEYYALLLFATVGMSLMGKAGDLLTIFLGLELLSISLYIMVGFFRTNLKSNESGLKYLLLGAFSTGFFLYGMAFVFGTTGTTNLAGIADFVSKHNVMNNVVFLSAAGLLLVGFGFKVSMAPFHMWSPDVYEGAPTPATAFLSTGPKAAGFAALVRVLMVAFHPAIPALGTLIAIFAVVTMIVGNISALVQTNIKRMLAYSSIAHAGYVLVAIAAGNAIGSGAVVYYLLAYTFMNLGAFGFVIFFERNKDEHLTIADYNGLGYRHPFWAACMAVFMFSLAGIPPTAGFFGKYYVFSAAIQQQMYWLVIIGVLNSLVSVYYYLRVVVGMYMYQPDPDLDMPMVKSMAIGPTLIIAVIGIFYLGLFPPHILQFTIDSVSGLF